MYKEKLVKSFTTPPSISTLSSPTRRILLFLVSCSCMMCLYRCLQWYYANPKTPYRGFVRVASTGPQISLLLPCALAPGVTALPTACTWFLKHTLLVLVGAQKHIRIYTSPSRLG